MKTLPALLTLAAATLLPTLQAASAHTEELANSLRDQGKDLFYDIKQTKKVVRDGLRLRALSQDDNLGMRVKQFNATLEEFITACAAEYKCEREVMEKALLDSNFGRILTTGSEFGSQDLPNSRRVMVLYGAQSFQQETGDTPSQHTPYAYSIYYTKDADVPKDGNKRVQLYSSAHLKESVGWIPASHIKEWQHNIVLQMCNPQNRQIEIADSGSPAYIPNFLFYAEAGNDIDPKGATGVFNKFAGKSGSGKLAAVRPLLHNYQMATGAVAQNDSYNQAEAQKFVQDYGVQMTLPPSSYNPKVILPIVGTGDYSYVDATGQASMPYKVMMLQVGKSKPQENAAAQNAAKTQIYIVMDLSGSMEKFLEGLKDALKAQVDTIPAEYRDRIQMGFIGFRDDPVQGGRTYKAFKFYNRKDGRSMDNTPFYNYTYDSLLPVEDFISRLEQVRSPRQELESQGIRGSAQERAVAELKADDIPERLYPALDEALTSPLWASGDDVRRFVVIVGDAPDKSAKSGDEGISEAARMREAAESKNIYFAPLYLDNGSYDEKRKKRFRDIGQRQFNALGGRESSVVHVDKDGNITDGHDFSAAFKAIIGTIISRATDGKADNGLEDANQDNLLEMMRMADSLFSGACFAASDNLVSKVGIGAGTTQEVDTSTGSQEYWVTEYDPLAVAAGASEQQSLVYERYALMTKPQLEKWVEVALSVYFRMLETDPENESAIYKDLAALFLSGSYSESEVQRAYASENKWDQLIEWAQKKLPCPSPFLTNFFRFKKGQKINFSFKRELDAFGRGITALREKLESGQVMQAADEVKFNEKQNSSNALPDDKKIYKIPLKFLP